MSKIKDIVMDPKFQKGAVNLVSTIAVAVAINVAATVITGAILKVASRR